MFFSLMWFSGCRFSTAAIQPSSARQLPILAALNEENPTLSPPIITEPCALFNTFLRKILFAALISSLDGLLLQNYSRSNT